MADPWQFISDFGDTAVTLPIAAFVLTYLLWSRHWRAAFAWVLAVVGCGAALALIKLALRSCAHNWASSQFLSASGHTAMSAVIYGGLALLIATRWRLAWTALVMILVAAIGLSRIILGAHHPLEVTAGLVIGGTAVILLHLFDAPDRQPLPPLAPMIGVAAIMLVMHGVRWPIEEYLIWLAGLIRHTIPACAQV
jgi:membrane-associated phospholipid phosphatase